VKIRNWFVNCGNEGRREIASPKKDYIKINNKEV
jgi:hypothetical protein